MTALPKKTELVRCVAIVSLAGLGAMASACHDTSSTAGSPTPDASTLGAANSPSAPGASSVAPPTTMPSGAPTPTSAPSSSGPPPVSAPPAQDVSPVLAASLATLAKAPGLGAIVTKNGNVIALGTTGLRKVGDPTALTTSDRFQMNAGMVAVTATLAARLVEEGKLAWDSTLGDVLPNSSMNAMYKSTTLRDLLAQRAGAPTSIPAGDVTNARAAANPADARNGAVADLLVLGPTGAPGTFAPSDASVLLANAMLEAAAGQPWESLVQSRVFAPLGMTSCASITSDANANDGGASPTIPWGHILGDDGTFAATAPGGMGESPAAFAPATGLRCTLTDWSRFVSVHLSAAQANAAGVASVPTPLGLSLASFATLQKPVGFANAPAWNVVARAWAGKTRALNAASVGPSSVTVTWALPDKNIAIVVAVNEGGRAALNVADRAVSALVGVFVNGQMIPGADAGAMP